MATIIGGKSYSDEYIKDPKNQEELRNAVVNGGNNIYNTDNSGNLVHNTNGNTITPNSTGGMTSGGSTYKNDKGQDVTPYTEGNSIGTVNSGTIFDPNSKNFNSLIANSKGNINLQNQGDYDANGNFTGKNSGTKSEAEMRAYYNNINNGASTSSDARLKALRDRINGVDNSGGLSTLPLSLTGGTSAPSTLPSSTSTGNTNLTAYNTVQNNVQGNSSYGVQPQANYQQQITNNYSGTWEQSAPYQQLIAKFQNAIANGGDVSGIQAEAEALKNAWITGQQQEQANNQIIQQTMAGNNSITSAQQSRDAIIQARLTEQLGLTDGQIRDAEGNLVKATDTINANTYDAQETQRATGIQKGIQYSQQGQALENGISRAGAKLIVDAGKDRDTAIANIKDRIASLKSGASYELQSSQAQADSDKYALLQKTIDANTARQQQLDDIKAQHDYQDKTIADANAYDTAKTEKQYTHEEQMKAVDFDNQLKAMNIDNNYKTALVKLDTTEKLKVMKVQNDYEVAGKKIDLASAIKLAGVNAGYDMQKVTAQINASASENNARIKASADENNARIKAETVANASKAIAEKNQFLNTFLASDPTFNPYNLKDAKSQKQLKYLADLNGVSVETLRTLLGTTPSGTDSALEPIAKQKGVSVSTLKNQPVNNVQGKALTWGAMILGLAGKNLTVPLIKTK